MKNKTFLGLFLLLTATVAFAQTPDKAKLDSYFDALAANNKFMGSVELSQNGKTVYSHSVGFTDVAKDTKINAGTKFRIGSISKTFTTSLIFKAIEDKKLKLEDNIGSYFPSVPNASKITVAQLLSHRSGIHNFTNDESYLTYRTQPQTEAQMVSIIAKGGSDFEPGSKADYSNSNFVLLSYILEKVYKKPYKTLLEEKITKPLGLKNTYYGGKINPANNEAYSYRYTGSWDAEPETDMSIPMGAGAVVSNPSDLSRFIEALFTGKIVSAASLEKMKTIQDEYGMGLFEMPVDGSNGYGHTGGIDGFTSALIYFPQEKLTYAMTSNGRDIDKIGTTMLQWFKGEPFEIPTFKTYSYTPAELDSFTGNYTSPDIPLGIAVTKNGTTLMAQASGQGGFPLDAIKKNIFEFKAAGIVMEFSPEKGTFVLKQGGGTYTFTKTK